MNPTKTDTASYTKGFFGSLLVLGISGVAILMINYMTDSRKDRYRYHRYITTILFLANNIIYMHVRL